MSDLIKKTFKWWNEKISNILLEFFSDQIKLYIVNIVKLQLSK